LKEKTYKKDIHALAPSLCDFFLEPAVWPWDRLISAMNEGSDGDLEIQSFEEVEKNFRHLDASAFVNLLFWETRLCAGD